MEEELAWENVCPMGKVIRIYGTEGPRPGCICIQFKYIVTLRRFGIIYRSGP